MDFHNLRQLVLNMDALFALKIGIGIFSSIFLLALSTMKGVGHTKEVN